LRDNSLKIYVVCSLDAPVTEAVATLATHLKCTAGRPATSCSQDFNGDSSDFPAWEAQQVAEAAAVVVMCEKHVITESGYHPRLAAIKRQLAEKPGVRLIPVHLTPCEMRESGLSQLQPAGRPHPQGDADWLAIARSIRMTF
jgi:hypothetical protein